MWITDRFKRFALRFLPERLLQNLKKFHYARKLRRSPESAEPDLRVVKHLVRPGARVIDLGANIGVYTQYLAGLVGPFGKVFSIEPVPQTYEILVSNIDQLGLINVQTFNVAVSGRDGVVYMEVPQYAAGGENYYEARIIATPGATTRRVVEVPARTLDGLFGPEDRIEFVKCDVEGHERVCLSGAAKLLRASRPAWLIEVSGNPDRADSPAADLFAFLASHGYEAYRFDGQLLRKRIPGDRSVNYFFLTPAQVARLPRTLFDGGQAEVRRAA
jgi:FkbM family methyltransferase